MQRGRSILVADENYNGRPDYNLAHEIRRRTDHQIESIGDGISLIGLCPLDHHQLFFRVHRNNLPCPHRLGSGIGPRYGIVDFDQRQQRARLDQEDSQDNRK